ncbi:MULTISPECIES: saccharopine dehydrogenase NADP-binding domain-containing protein [Staphylococcus]|uniref:saccharopine dehydrogenase NADP-binding domain-containing protein n=1 Tax=Staphylococcus TaxID=1279 RepID=UPI00076B6029|nr:MULTISPECIES: saccharopine dehydrogenase NADP-binding domain-containing protein [Staphylococcus]AMG64982.1 saccharopine dehydrogenase [Staphylococcus lugdunensis]MCI2814158.1 saccharopine dehydrogenase NADP-binding domain-containing protein [Staphylococcus lugdunensis]MDU0966494.1 saccharopine dehydrogenase NADP-binding domain-containing protein [Staphylococcus lugdunensis]MDU1963784.1 saccharopine dehydrogenase NADP-binding domain-containing protein [Staphylococcus lugdunensis]MDU2322327.1
MVQCIGIIGGNGVIGYKLATLLANHQNINVIITSRQLRPQHELPQHVTFTTVHLEREDEIISLIRRCDLIINCTGKAIRQLLRYCFTYHTHYIDASGDIQWANNEAELHSQLSRAKLNAIQFAGVNPGLTEVLLDYTYCRNEVKSLEMYFSGTGHLSKSAVLEMMTTSNPPYAYNQMYLVQGELTPTNYLMTTRQLESDAPPYHCIPIINQHFINYIKQTTINEAHFFNAFKDDSIIYKMAQAKYHFDQHDITSAITILRNEFEVDANRHEPFTCISLLLNDNKTISIRWSQDWNDVTALTLYWTAILILQGNVKQHGLTNLYEAIDAETLLNMLQQESHCYFHN